MRSGRRPRTTSRRTASRSCCGRSSSSTDRSTPTRRHPGWAQVAELFNYSALGSTIASQHNQWGPRKPFVVGETGSWYDANYPNNKGDWFKNIPAAAKNMPYLRGIQFYDEDVSAA